MSDIQSFQPIPTTPPNNGSSAEKQAVNKPKRIRKTVGIPTVGALIMRPGNGVGTSATNTTSTKP